MSDTIENDVFQQALAESVHFSFKTINSNIEKGGLRLGKAQALDLPYISARTLLAEGFLIPTDYQANAGKTASIFKVVKAAMLDDDVGEEDAEFQQQVAQLKPSINNIFTQPYQAGTEHIDIRMRQLLLPKQDGYISVSPLTAAGVNYLLNQEVDKVNEARKEKDSPFYRIQTAVFGIGGANPQNVGSLVRAMQRPIVLAAPQIDTDIIQAFQIFYNGYSCYVPTKIRLDREQKPIIPYIILWAKMLNQQLQATLENDYQDWIGLGISAPETNLKVREAELVFLKNILNFVLYQGQQCFKILNAVSEELPTILASTDEEGSSKPQLTPLLHPDVDFVEQGLIDPNLRDDVWRIDFADHLAKKITKAEFKVDNEKKAVAISLDKNAVGYIARRLREMLR